MDDYIQDKIDSMLRSYAPEPMEHKLVEEIDRIVAAAIEDLVVS